MADGEPAQRIVPVLANPVDAADLPADGAKNPSTTPGTTPRILTKEEIVAAFDKIPLGPQVPIPPLAYQIPSELYDKAGEHQDQLTDDERQRLLSRGDLVGKALAYPERLTADELNELLERPPPAVVRANVQLVTGGALSTPTELWAKARTAREREDLGSLSHEEWNLLATNFACSRAADMLSWAPRSKYVRNPGMAQLVHLLSAREGYDLEARYIAADKFSEDMPRLVATLLQQPRASLSDLVSGPAHITPASLKPGHSVASVPKELPEREQLDRWGRPRWPPLVCVPMRAENAFFKEVADKLDAQDTHVDDIGAYVAKKWHALTDEEKAPYEAMSEAARLAAWDKHDRLQEERSNGVIRFYP